MLQQLKVGRPAQQGTLFQIISGLGSKMLSDDEVSATIAKELKEEHANNRAPEMALKNRLLFHLAHKMDDQEKLMMRHQDLTDTQGTAVSAESLLLLPSHSFTYLTFFTTY